MKKLETNADIQELLTIRNKVLKIEEDIEIINKVKQDLIINLLNLQHNCEHSVVVRFKSNETGREARCLCCNRPFYGSSVGLDFYFNNIIDMQKLETEEDKVTLALSLYAQVKKLNPSLNDKKIVEMINKYINENRNNVQDLGFVKTIGKK